MSSFSNNSAGSTQAYDSHICDGCMPQCIRDPMSCLHKHKLTFVFPCQINVPDLMNRGPGSHPVGALGGYRSRGIQKGHGSGG